MKRSHSYLLASLLLAVFLIASIQIAFASSPARVSSKLIPEDIPEPPANLTFGGKDMKTLYVTARTSLYTAPMETTGHRFGVAKANAE